MTRVLLLMLGSLATVVFAAFILVAVPRAALPEAPANPTLPPVEPAESPLQPYTAEQWRGREVYVENGCFYCHSQQVRDPIISNDVDRGWGRPSYPSDYIYDSPALLGTQRTGPDLINVGVRLPDPSWHMVHLYQPRALVPWSIMPAYPYLFEVKEEGATVEEAVKTPTNLLPAGQKLVATADAKALVAYLLSLKRDFPPPELKVEREKLRAKGQKK